MRISRGNRLLGERSVGQIQKGIADSSLFLTDSYYHEDTSEWLPLADFISRLSQPKPVKPVGRPCYCGSGLSFQACHGDGSRY
jgi:SEC-C motif